MIIKNDNHEPDDAGESNLYSTKPYSVKIPTEVPSPQKVRQGVSRRLGMFNYYCSLSSGFNSSDQGFQERSRVSNDILPGLSSSRDFYTSSIPEQNWADQIKIDDVDIRMKESIDSEEELCESLGLNFSTNSSVEVECTEPLFKKRRII